MNLWLVKVEVRDQGPATLAFRAGLEEEIARLGSIDSFKVVWSLEKVDFTFLLPADGYREAMMAATAVCSTLGTPSTQLAIAVAWCGEAEQGQALPPVP